MPARQIPVRPDAELLRQQATDLLRALREGDPTALADFQQFHPKPPDPAAASIAATSISSPSADQSTRCLYSRASRRLLASRLPLKSCCSLVDTPAPS